MSGAIKKIATASARGMVISDVKKQILAITIPKPLKICNPNLLLI